MRGMHIKKKEQKMLPLLRKKLLNVDSQYKRTYCTSVLYSTLTIRDLPKHSFTAKET
jgi:hypothetical protein